MTMGWEEPRLLKQNCGSCSFHAHLHEFMAVHVHNSGNPPLPPSKKAMNNPDSPNSGPHICEVYMQCLMFLQALVWWTHV